MTTDIAHARAALARAIADFTEAERKYQRARDAAAAASSAVHEALSRGESLFGLIEARSETTNAFSQAGDAMWQSGQIVVERANDVVREAGEDMLAAIADFTNLDPGIVAWRDARNALVKNSDAPLPNEALA
jgi:phage shock protein A